MTISIAANSITHSARRSLTNRILMPSRISAASHNFQTPARHLVHHRSMSIASLILLSQNFMPLRDSRSASAIAIYPRSLHLDRTGPRLRARVVMRSGDST
jgi:hypothetical protein